MCDDELTLVGMEDGVVRVIRNERPSRGDRGIREDEERSTVFTLDCRTSHVQYRHRGQWRRSVLEQVDRHKRV